MVEKDERTDHVLCRRGQNPAHLHAAEVAAALLNDGLQHANRSYIAAGTALPVGLVKRLLQDLATAL
jgi:hypothetical protein